MDVPLYAVVLADQRRDYLKMENIVSESYDI